MADKFTKLSKACFSMEYFTADFSGFSSIYAKSCLLGGRLCTRRQIQAFQGYS